MKFQLHNSYTLWDMPRTKSKYEKFQRAITQKWIKQELWFLCTALLLIEIYLLMKFQLNNSYTLWDMPRTKSKYEKFQRAITQKWIKQELWFLCTALLLIEIYLLMKFQLNNSYTLWDMPRTKSKYEKFQRAITQKWIKQELWFLCTALLLIEIYLLMKFQLHNS
jgi:predicted nucleic acid-binding protein